MSRCDIYLLFTETVYGDHPVCLHLCTGACCVAEHAVLGGGVLPGRPETDTAAVRTTL